MSGGWRALDLRCPRCRGLLHETGAGEPELRCEPCHRVYPVVCDIPDLRVFDDPYIAAADDRAKGRRIAERAADTDLAGLLAWYYANTPAVPPADAQRYIRGMLGAAARSAAMLAAWDEGRAAGGGRVLLDLGCGTASLLVAARQGGRCAAAVGVDIAFRWLVVARKRLEEAGVGAPLVCACAEALPFGDARFDVVAAESTLEVVEDQRAALAEARRTLRTGGRLYLTTPNRLSLGPDPHLGVPAGGWWPPALLAWAARRRGAVPPRRRLLSWRALRRSVGRAGFRVERLFPPPAPPGLRHGSRALALAAGAYDVMARTPVVRLPLLLVGPLLALTAERP